MAHARRVIREAVVTALAGAGTAAGARVYDHPYNARKTFPALVIEDVGANHSDGNVTETQSLNAISFAPDLERRYRFAVICEVQQSATAAAERDDLCAEVEVAIDVAFNAGDVTGVKSVHPLAYQAADDNAGDKPIRRGLQIFEAVYLTPLGDPSTTL